MKINIHVIAAVFVTIFIAGCGTASPVTPPLDDAASTPDAATPTAPMPRSDTVSMLFVGDIMLDRSVWLKTKAAGDYNHPFLLIDPLFEAYDVRVANLEGPITTNQSIANGTGGARFTFTFSPEFLDPLKKRFEVLSLANNHTHNFGRSGLAQTRNYLSEKEIVYFGDPWNTAGELSVTTTYNNISFAFVGFHELVEDGFDRVVSEVERLDPLVDVVIVLPHWGHEYVTDKPSPVQKQEAHALIDAGADVVMGGHPHVVQPIELYNDRVIFYSLGNFIFDQYFSEETMTGLAVGTEFIKEDTRTVARFDLVPLDISRESQPSVADEAKRTTVLRQLERTSLVEERVREQIGSGTLSIEWTR